MVFLEMKVGSKWIEVGACHDITEAKSYMFDPTSDYRITSADGAVLFEREKQAPSRRQLI